MLKARTISRVVCEWLPQISDGRVLAVFDHACDLLIPGKTIIGLVTPQVGAGPLSVVVDGSSGCFKSLRPGTPANLSGDRIRVGPLEINLQTAVTWEPRPDWDFLRARRAEMVSHLSALRDRCRAQAPGESVIHFLDTVQDLPPRPLEVSFQCALKALWAGRDGDADRLQEGAAQLAGLGVGLTPSGDDFLAGLMLWAWLSHPEPQSLCATLFNAVIGRTTQLSTALLQAAARGECSAAWHQLLRALCEGGHRQMAEAARGVLSHGATSGADMLAGFLWGGLNLGNTPLY